MSVRSPRTLTRALLALLLPLGAACSGGGDGGGTTGPTPAISMTVSPASLTLTQGASGTATVTITRTSFTDPVALAVSGVPNGTTATFSPTSLTGATQSSTLTVATGVGTAAGTYSLSITAGGNGVATQTQTLALTVNAPTPTTSALTVATAGTGTGTVSSSPAGITCPGTCTASFTNGSSVTLTATPTNGSTFAGWSGGGCSGTGTCVVSVSAAATVTATFTAAAPTTSTLTVATAGTGTGTVTSNTGGINCPGTCTANITNGTSVTLTATAASGSTFTGWSGGGCSGTGTCVVAVSAATTVTANFSAVAQTFALTVANAGTGTGSVTSSPAGITCPGTCTNSYASGTQVTLTATPTAGSTFAGWSGACTGSAACVVTMSAAQNVTATFNLAPSFGLTITPASVSVQQGASGTATVNVARNNGFAGAIALTTSGAPNGLTVTPNPASATGATSTLNISAAANTTPGTYTITVAGTGTGVANQSATFSVVVTSAPIGGGGNVTFDFSTCDATQIPIWFAVQTGGGAWTRVNASGTNAFSFNASGATGIAWVTQSGSQFMTQVQYLAGSEVPTGTSNRCGFTAATGTKTLTGSVAGLAQTDQASITIGGAAASVNGFLGTAFTLTNVASGPRDLIATRQSLSGTSIVTNKAIIRHNVNYTSTIPLLDFASSEAFNPATANVTVGNANGETTFGSVSFLTANGYSASFSSNQGSGSTIAIAGVPTSQLVAGDLHQLAVVAIPSASNTTQSRIVLSFFRTVADQTLTLGPALSTASITSIGTSPYLRLRAAFASQSAYNQMATVTYTQTNRSVSISASAAYFGGLPGTWQLDIPDMSAAGYLATWALQSGTKIDYTAVGIGGNIQALTNGPTDGVVLQEATSSGSSTAFLRFLSARSIAIPIRKP